MFPRIDFGLGSIFGSSSQNDHRNQANQAKSISLGDGSQSIVITSPGKIAIQIFLDLGFKNYTKHMISDDTTASEVTKNLKQRYAQNQVQAPSTPASQANKQGLMQSYGISNSQSTANLDIKNAQSSKQKANQVAPGKGDQVTHKEEYRLFLINTRATNPFLFVRKLSPNDIIFRVFHKAVQEFIHKDFDENRFKLVFLKSSELEAFLIQKTGTTNSLLEEENHVVSQLGKSIINNKTYERKGKLYKKSLYTDKFKERQFVLDKDQLFYYKNEKQKDKNFNLIMLSNAQIHILENFSKQYKHVFQIENENRKYILSTKSPYDLEQWVFAIQGQIRLSKDNKNIADVNQSITLIEKDIAQNDMHLITKIFKPKNVIFNPVQQILLDYVNDPFINELLPNLTNYMLLVREKEYQRQACEKAKDIYQQLMFLQKKLQNQLGAQSNIDDTRSLLNESSITDQIDKAISSQSEDYKRYKELKPEQKIQCLFSEEDLSMIEEEVSKYVSKQQQIQQQQEQNQISLSLNPKIFNGILLKINRIIKYNYLEDFFEKKKVELLSIPYNNFKMNMTKMEFNSIGPSIKAKNQKNVNIFESMLLKKHGQKAQGDRSNFSPLQSSIHIDQNYQQQVRNHAILSQDSQKALQLGVSQEFDVSRLGTVTKVSGSFDQDAKISVLKQQF